LKAIERVAGSGARPARTQPIGPRPLRVSLCWCRGPDWFSMLQLASFWDPVPKCRTPCFGVFRMQSGSAT